MTANFIFAAQPVSTGYWSDTAIGGHDTTGYYQPGLTGSSKVAQGTKQFVVQWQGADWQFASQASADKFAADPERYVPRYNGFCANALSLDEGLIATSGKVWEFFGDDLHLFYAERGRQRWLNGDWQSYQATADLAWQALSQ
ncbi:YHS domain-containing (seleno)protein [Reinekea thalattae]|uniref:YHS domain-containing protein n=1 Tax=Reinekea thalattae TaxID=2593301 RepID=A0A5C8Z7F5_9GAMM|nr:YHS domain-containing (seleno)protein [Reinekea thalattae]TXR53882.1 YHS domain-containing protein [Reinekea thalattae]